MTDVVDIDDDMTRIDKFRGMGEAMSLKGKPVTQYIERCMEKKARERASHKRRTVSRTRTR